MMRLRDRNRLASGMVPGHSSLTSAPPFSAIPSNNSLLHCGPAWLRPPANTATVRPARPMPYARIASNAPLWAAASAPMAPPETTRCPACAACTAMSVVSRRPYSLTPREPTMPTGCGQLVNAARSPLPHRHSGGAQRPSNARSLRRVGHHTSCGAMTHCLPSMVNQPQR